MAIPYSQSGEKGSVLGGGAQWPQWAGSGVFDHLRSFFLLCFPPYLSIVPCMLTLFPDNLPALEAL